MTIRIDPLQESDLPEVTRIEQLVFVPPWSASAFKAELSNRIARYFVLRDSPNGADHGRLIGYAGIWIIIDETHLTNIAIDPAYQGKGYGEYLLVEALRRAIDAEAGEMTLEVRASNAAAQRLYAKYGFTVVGRRKNYYREVGEDAVLMTVHGLTSEAYGEKLNALAAANAARVTGVAAGADR